MCLYNNSQALLMKELSIRVFGTGDYDCTIIVCKNPHLLALLCCLESKTSISSPYPPGTNFYYPIDSGSKFRRVTIKSHQIEDGFSSYWYNEIKGSRSSICTSWKSASLFEEKAILAKDQKSDDWINQRDVPKPSLKKHSGQKFPTIVSTRKDFEYWLNKQNIDGSSLMELLGFNDFEEFKSRINFLPARSVKSYDDDNYIWINSIPDTIDNKKHIILLSSNSSRFEEFNSEISELYLHTENKKIWKFEELPHDLKVSAEKCSITTPISIWSIK